MYKDTVCFDDVLLVPQKSDIATRDEIQLETQLGDKQFRLPIISSPMDTVTEATMAIAMFAHGGLGIIHRYNTMKEQCKIIRNVTEKFENTGNSNINNVAAAIGTSSDFKQRATSLYECGARIICIDVAHGHHELVESATKTLKCSVSKHYWLK